VTQQGERIVAWHPGGASFKRGKKRGGVTPDPLEDVPSSDQEQILGGGGRGSSIGGDPNLGISNLYKRIKKSPQSTKENRKVGVEKKKKKQIEISSRGKKRGKWRKKGAPDTRGGLDRKKIFFVLKKGYNL